MIISDARVNRCVSEQMEATGPASCPVCGESFPLIGLERHVNSHLDEEENARDHAISCELASTSQSFIQDINSCNESSVTCHMCDVLVPLEDWDNHCHLHEIQAQEHLIVECENDVQYNVMQSPKLGEQTALLDKSIVVNKLDLKQSIINQKRCDWRVDEGIMNLLRDCLYSENQNSSTVIAANIDHFESCANEDIGWGCGWRNIQMLSSHLLTHTWGRQALFGGAGFVPDIPSLQKWLEFAWANGFDEPGAKFYQHKICGSKEWIGTTECATLFRSFGLRARIIDFSGKSKSDGQMSIDRWLHHSTVGSITTKKLEKSSSLFMDNQIHHNVQCDICGIYPLRGIRFKSKKRTDYDLCIACMSRDGNLDDYEQISCPSKEKEVANDEDVNHESLVNWVWNHFIRGMEDGVSKAQMDKFQGHVFTSACTPLYFQHQGHSRTIVGMQRRKTSGSKEDLFLLILDPSTKTNELVYALRSRKQWQKLIKRGVRTLKKRSYQICFIDPGIAEGEELQQLKTLKSERFLY